MATWRNWAGNQTARPVRVATPADPEQLAALVREAVAAGLRVKPIGAGHSFSDIAVTDGLAVRLDRMAGLIDVDVPTGLVTAQAGMPLHRLNRALAEHGLAMSNLGDIDRQTIGGATATGTHGTGAAHGGLSTQIRALELVLADGRRVRCAADERPELFRIARVGLGALGVVTSVTAQCVPAFALHAAERPMRLAEVLDGLDEFATGVDHAEFYWFPHTDRTLTKRNVRVPAGTPLRPLRGLRAWWDDEFLSNAVFSLTNRVASRVPAVVPLVNRTATHALSAREYTDESYRVFVSPRRVRFREMEYGIPRPALAEVLGELTRWTERAGERISFPVEVRFAAADDIPLSTAFDRDSAYVAVHQYVGLPHERYFRAVEDIMGAVGGRPHWGKLHGLRAATLRARYPCFDEFVALRDELDPDRVFANRYLDRVLGECD